MEPDGTGLGPHLWSMLSMRGLLVGRWGWLLRVGLAAAALALLAPRALDAAMVNAWSLRYLQRAKDPSVGVVAVPPPPEGHARAVIWRAREALVRGEPEEALRLVDAAASAGDPAALSIEGQARESLGDFQGALRAWLRARDYRGLLAAASRATEQDRLEDALTAYRASREVELEGGVLPLAIFLAGSYSDRPAAVVVLRQGLAEFPRSRLQARWLTKLGDLLRADGSLDEAEAAYKRALEEDSDLADAYIGLGWVQYEQGEGLEAAATAFQSAIAHAPHRGAGYFALGQLYAQEKRDGEADDWFARALECNPEVRWWYVERGNAARQAGNLTRALAVYQEALARFPDFAQVYYEMSNTYKLNEQPAQAMAAIEQALALMAPPNAYYCVRAGSIYEWAGENGRALQAYQQALLINPQNAVARKGVERLNK